MRQTNRTHGATENRATENRATKDRATKKHLLARLATAGIAVSVATATTSALAASTSGVAAASVSARTPIQHLVVIYQENESFDHYFGTYPVATNPAGEDPFTALPGTPSVNGLTASLLSSNPNGANPQRLDPGPNAGGVYNASLDSSGSNPGIDNTLTCSQNHNYQPEQQAFDGGLMDKFPGSVGSTSSPPEPGEPKCTANQDLDYYDGNTVTGYWNYSQQYAMSDNSFGTTFGPSTPGAINVISGDTGNVNLVNNNPVTPNANTSPSTALAADGQGGFSDINDSDPYYDDCSSTTSNIGMSNTSGSGVTNSNIGDILNQAGLSWGFFEGGFAPTTAAGSGGNPLTGMTTGYGGGPAGQSDKAVCASTHNVGAALGGTGSSGTQPYGTKADYVQHHQPFQYYATTANPRHVAPASLTSVGTDTQSFTGGCYGCGTPEFNTANHQYDISEFDQLVAGITAGSYPASQLPAVSYLKAPAYEDEHPANSDPIDGQHFVTQEINALMQSPDWSSTAVVVAYDDSDGWYDHVYAGNEGGATGVQNQSSAGGSPSLGDAENPSVCGGTTIVGSALASGSSAISITAANDSFTYTIGAGALKTVTIPNGNYSAASMATELSSLSGGAITAESNSSNQLILTDNGLSSLTLDTSAANDALSSLGLTVGASSTPASPTLTNTAGQPESGRCGLGPRLPLMVISPYAKTNFVDHTLSDQASVVNFIEYNWGLPGIPGSADRLLNDEGSTAAYPAGAGYDFQNMFDFSHAVGVAGPTPHYLDSSTFQPTPTLDSNDLPPGSSPGTGTPEAGLPLLLPVLALGIAGGATWFVTRRRRAASVSS